MQDILRKPVERLLGEGLRRAAEMGEFRRVNARQADMDLLGERTSENTLLAGYGDLVF